MQPGTARPGTLDDLLLRLARDADARDPYGVGHGSRVASYATAVGIVLQLPDRDLVALHRGGALHDIGNVAIPLDLLRKPGALTPGEFDIVKRHTVIGDVLCAGLENLAPLRPIIRSHHERSDGSGYPDGLVERHIPLLAQIVGLVDAYDALTTSRPYHPARSAEAACEALRIEARQGRRSPALVTAFVAVASSRRLAHLRAAEGEASLGA